MDTKHKCYKCNKQFKDGDLVTALYTYITNDRRGDFVGNQPIKFVHVNCL